MDVARAVARRSTCLRRAVGCVLVDRHGCVISTGYNGVAPGMPHCNEATGRVAVSDTADPRYPWAEEYANACPGAQAPSGTALDACLAAHAETNALVTCRLPFEVGTCYVTTAPCVNCVKGLLRTSCDRIVFAEDYPTSGRDLWVANGRDWVKFDPK